MADNALTILNNLRGALAPNATQLKHADQDLGTGIQAPFGVIGYKGGRWSVRSRGNTKVLERVDERGRPDGFVPYLDLVILYAASRHSKSYYEKPYVEGSDDPPDCWSTDGLKPDQAAPRKQNPQCQDCRHNEFGSRINAATGAKGKACADFRRWAVVPYEDIDNVLMGGPMLLRIPPASLGNVGEYSDKLKANSVPYAAIATRVGFDGKEAYPKLTFEPLAALTADEVERVRRMQDHPLVERIVSEQLENMVAQVGSEQGVAVTKAASVPLSGEQVTKGNGVTGPVKKSPFSVVDNTGPSYAGQKPAAGGHPAQPGPEPQPTGQTAPAATAANPPEGLTPEQLRIKELEAKLAAAEAKPTKGPRKRPGPVSPSPTAEHHQEMIETEGDEAASPNDPALASISSRLEKLL